MLVHHVEDGDDARLHRECEEEPSDPEGDDARRRVEGSPAVRRRGVDQPSGQEGDREQEERRTEHGRVEKRVAQRHVVVDGLPGRERDQAEVAGDHGELGEQVIPAGHRRLHPGQVDRPGRRPGRRGREEQRRRDDRHGGQERQEGDETAPRSLEEEDLEEEEGQGQREGDLLRPHGQHRGEERRSVAHVRPPPPRPGLPAVPPAHVEERGEQVEEGREGREPLDDVRDRLGLDGVGGEEEPGRHAHGPGRRHERRPPQPGGLEDGEDQAEEEQRAGDVDGQVHRAVEGGVVPADGAVDREGGEGDAPGWAGPRTPVRRAGSRAAGRARGCP